LTKNHDFRFQFKIVTALIISREHKCNLVVQGVTFARATCDPAEGFLAQGLLGHYVTCSYSCSYFSVDLQVEDISSDSCSSKSVSDLI